MMREGLDYYYDPSGLMVMTSRYLLARGYCCQSNCRHCPFGFMGRNPADNPPEPAWDESKKMKARPAKELDDY